VGLLIFQYRSCFAYIAPDHINNPAPLAGQRLKVQPITERGFCFGLAGIFNFIVSDHNTNILHNHIMCNVFFNYYSIEIFSISDIVLSISALSFLRAPKLFFISTSINSSALLKSWCFFSSIARAIY